MSTNEHQAYDQWAKGYGIIEHDPQIQALVKPMAKRLVERGAISHSERFYELLLYADRLANAAMWLVVHMTFAKNVYLDGRALKADDFKDDPQGHTGGSLNMVPAYVGYLTANAISGLTRSSLMGQGHCVSAVWACSALAGDLFEHCAQLYPLSDDGLSKLCRDFYGYALNSHGKPKAYVGSHVNASTPGGLIEGGYLGFAELLYPHMPLPGERLVTFLSDGAFEEQRGGDWAPRWWRAQDSGLVMPILINNGRRIDQRSTTAQQGGTTWLKSHLKLNSFDPIVIDGRDPAAFAWAIIEMEERLIERGAAADRGEISYPIMMPYAIAESIKGAGFIGEGTNLAHGVPLKGDPKSDAEVLDNFNHSLAKLFVPKNLLERSITSLRSQVGMTRPSERDHAMATRKKLQLKLPKPPWRKPGQLASPMDGIDEYFVQLVEQNPKVRVRVGNPDELRSNRLNKTLNLLQHRVCAPEKGIAESIYGKVITALNEEAVVCAALGNKGGINLVATYEAFAVKMLGAIRQEITFARQQQEISQNPSWLSVPIIATSHTWENGKNEYSHQDTTFCEALMSEMSDVSRVFFVGDFNSALAVAQRAYSSYGQIWTMVIPKTPLPIFFTPDQAFELARDGAIVIGNCDRPKISLMAIGAFQLVEALKTSQRLKSLSIPHNLCYVIEPSLFREPRDEMEAKRTPGIELKGRLATALVVMSHCRPEAIAGILRPFNDHTGIDRAKFLGYINRGGTLDVFGMLFANRCTWAHALYQCAKILKMSAHDFLTDDELSAVLGISDPNHLRISDR